MKCGRALLPTNSCPSAFCRRGRRRRDDNEDGTTTRFTFSPPLPPPPAAALPPRSTLRGQAATIALPTMKRRRRRKRTRRVVRRSMSASLCCAIVGPGDGHIMLAAELLGSVTHTRGAALAILLYYISYNFAASGIGWGARACRGHSRLAYRSSSLARPARVGVEE